MKLSSPQFHENEKIPSRFTQEGENISPPLEWKDVPEDCKSLVLICEDPDAPNKPVLTHWLMYNISPLISALPEGLPQQEQLDVPVVASQGINAQGKFGYLGPKPPPGSGSHRYIFTLCACDRELIVEPGAEKEAVLKALQGSILATARLIGRYENKNEPRHHMSA